MSITKTRQLLVDVARELCAKKGLENITMNDIAVASGKGRRTLYTYFRSKEEIFYAVIEGELERLSEKMDEVANLDIALDEKMVTLIYTHLHAIRETVARNGSLRAEFFRNIWMVEKARKKFDMEERLIFERVLQEGCDQGLFAVDRVRFLADIFHYSLKGLEVPHIYDRIGESIGHANSRPIVMRLVQRILGIPVAKN